MIWRNTPVLNVHLVHFNPHKVKRTASHVARTSPHSQMEQKKNRIASVRQQLVNHSSSIFSVITFYWLNNEDISISRFFNVNWDIKIWRRGRYLSSKSFFRVFSKIRLLRKHHFTFSTRKVSNISRSQNAKTSNIRKLVSVTSCAKNRSRMATAIAFCRQNDAGSRERTT